MHPLDDRYVLADTRWQMTFAPGGKEEAQILAESVFLLDTGLPEPRILVYLSKQDLLARLREHDIRQHDPGKQDPTTP